MMSGLPPKNDNGAVHMPGIEEQKGWKTIDKDT